MLDWTNTWYLILDIWYLISDNWYMILVSDTWYLIFDIWDLISDTRYLILDIWYLISDTWYLILDIWYLTIDTWYLIFDIFSSFRLCISTNYHTETHKDIFEIKFRKQVHPPSLVSCVSMTHLLFSEIPAGVISKHIAC